MSVDRRYLILAAFAVFGIGLVVASTHLVPASGTVPLHASDGPQVDVQMDNTAELNVEDPFVDDNTIRIETSDGVVELSSNGPTSMTIDGSNVEGRFTELSQLSLNGRDLQIDPGDKSRVTLAGQPDRFGYDQLVLDDGTTDLKWAAAQGDNVSVTLRGLPSDTAVGVFDPNSNSIVDATTTSTFGSATVSLPGDGSVREAQLTSPSGTPTLANPDPADGVILNQSQSSISVDISHPDISQTDLDVEVVFEGNVVEQQTISSNTTLSEPVSAERGGDYQWSVTATDRWGQTTTESFSFKVPDEVDIYDALNGSAKLVTGTQLRGKTVPQFQAEFFGANGETAQRAVTNGTIDLNDLRVEAPLTLRLRPDNSSQHEYARRNVFIPSIYEQTEVYLIPQNETETRDVVFELDDKTGEFGRNSVLQVQRQLTKDFDGDGDNETRYQTMAGDTFDVSGKREFTLLDGERYRLTLTNQDGDKRVLGEYDVTASVVEVLEVGEIKYSGDVSEGNILNAKLTTVNGDRVLSYRYRDLEDQTNSLSIEIRNLDTGETIHEVSNIVGPFGTYTETVPVKSTDEDVTYRVIVRANQDDDSEELTQTVGSIQDVGGQTGVPSRLLQLLSWGGIVAITGLVAIFDDAIASLVAWVMATALTVLGFISISGILLAFAGGIALIFNVARRAPVR